jgi:FAD/FMN-containing dehydrogenase/ferredoxin
VESTPELVQDGPVAARKPPEGERAAMRWSSPTRWSEGWRRLALRAAERRERRLGIGPPRHVARLLGEGASPDGALGTLRLAAYVIFGSPRQRLRLFSLHMLDRDTPRRARLVARLASELRPRLGEGCRVAAGGFERRLFSRDLARLPRAMGRALHRSTPLLVVQPRDEADVVALMRFAAERRLALFPRGVSSSAFGGAVPTRNGLVADFSAMAEVLAVDPAARIARVQPGVRWADLASRLARHGLVPVTTPSSRFSTVGGWASTGGLGLESYGHGALADALLAARVVVPAGRTLAVSREDGTLARFVGTEGQLGLFTEITLRVRPRPVRARPRLLYFDDLEAAIAWIERLVAGGARPSHVAVHDRERMAEENRLFRDRTGMNEPIVAERDAVLLCCDEPSDAEGLPTGGEAAAEVAARYIWCERFFPLKAQRLGPNLLASEVVLPLGEVRAYLAEVRRLAGRFGSAPSIEFSVARRGDAVECVVISAFTCDAARRLDYLLRLALVQLLTRAGVRRGGRPYGIGIWNAPFLRAARSAEDLRALRRAKRELDPQQILNPGKFFRVRTRFDDLWGPLFRPRVYALALTLLAAASPAAGALARRLARSRPHEERWPIPAPETERGRRLLLESAQRCTFCGACVSVCPAYLLTREELTTGRAKLQLAEALARGEEVAAAEAHRPFQCFVCGLCEEVCQTRLPLVACYAALEGWVEELAGRPAELIAEFAARADAARTRFMGAFSLDQPDWPTRAATSAGEFGPTLETIPAQAASSPRGARP